jgi:hypothetical protein
MSDTEKFWNAVAAKSGAKEWLKLDPWIQQVVLDGINLLLVAVEHSQKEEK